MYRYGMAWRKRAEGVGLQALIARAIPLPAWIASAASWRCRCAPAGRTVGVLLVQSHIEVQASATTTRTRWRCCARSSRRRWAALQVAEVDAGATVRPTAPVTTVGADAAAGAGRATDARAGAEPHAPAAGEPHRVSSSPMHPGADASLTLRHWPRDHTVFAGDDYLIRGVAGAILWRLATEQVQRGRSEFTTRELRLAGGDLGMPEVQDNLGVRLLLLERRLAERDCGITIARTGRGRFRLLGGTPAAAAGRDRRPGRLTAACRRRVGRDRVGASRLLRLRHVGHAPAARLISVSPAIALQPPGSVAALPGTNCMQPLHCWPLFGVSRYWKAVRSDAFFSARAAWLQISALPAAAASQSVLSVRRRRVRRNASGLLVRWRASSRPATGVRTRAGARRLEAGESLRRNLTLR